jgi:tetratricopeptide (TPR) repeat protein
MERASFRAALWPALVAALGIAVYANTLGNGFALDDLSLVRDDPRIRSLSSLPGLFVAPYWHDGEASGLYRPVANTSLALNRAVTGATPWGFHLGNVLLHGAVCALVWLVARRAGTHYGTALLAGALFAVHPIHVEAVANVAGRAELLAALFVLAAWLCHRKGWWIGAMLSYLLAILSKEGAILAPVLFFLDDLLLRSDVKRRQPRRLATYAGYLGAVVVMLVLRSTALGGLRGVEDATFFDNPAAALAAPWRMATALLVQSRYLALFVWPARLSSDYSYDAIPVVTSASDPRLLVALAVLAGIVALAIVGWKRSRTTLLAVAIWVLFFLPSSNLLFPTGTLMAERLAYLPSLGACLLVGHAFAWIASRDERRWHSALVVSICSIVVIALAARTWARTPVWKDNATLALRDVETYPRSAKLQAGAGIVHHAAGRTLEAEATYRKALEIYPDYAQIHYNLGMLLSDRGELVEAMRHLIRAAELSPGNPQPIEGIIVTRRRADDPSVARELNSQIAAEHSLPEPLRREASAP